MLVLQGRHVVCWMLGCTLAWTAMPAPVRAQAPAPAGIGDPLNLAQNTDNPALIIVAPSVQQELKLSDAQKSKVLELARMSNQKERDLTQALFLAGGKDPQAILAAGANFRHENDQAIGKILDAPQRERLSQIVLQSEGPLALARPEIAARLELKDAQNKAVRSILTHQRLSMGQLIATTRQGAAQGPLDPSQIAHVREQAGKIREQTTQQLGTLLDREQKANLNKLLGAPFDLATLDPSNPAARDRQRR